MGMELKKKHSNNDDLQKNTGGEKEGLSVPGTEILPGTLSKGQRLKGR